MSNLWETSLGFMTLPFQDTVACSNSQHCSAMHIYIYMFIYSTTYSSVAVAIDYCYKRLCSRTDTGQVIVVSWGQTTVLSSYARRKTPPCRNHVQVRKVVGCLLETLQAKMHPSSKTNKLPFAALWPITNWFPAILEIRENLENEIYLFQKGTFWREKGTTNQGKIRKFDNESEGKCIWYFWCRCSVPLCPIPDVHWWVVF